jgi:hypothetical protein
MLTAQPEGPGLTLRSLAVTEGSRAPSSSKVPVDWNVEICKYKQWRLRSQGIRPGPTARHVDSEL